MTDRAEAHNTHMPMGPRAFWAVLGATWLALAAPSLWDFMFGQWSAYSQGHELLLLSVVVWLMWRQWPALSALPGREPAWWAWLALLIGLSGYAFGRTQEFIRIEMLSLWWVGVSVLLACKGWAGLRQTWFIWLFALFIIPIPFSVVLMLTSPLKEAVSALATLILGAVGYPVGRSGVVITAGQYQLLVAEACAGLHSMFILEAMGLLYSYLVNHRSWLRNALLATFAVPVSFLANVIRVMILVLVTYHFGDAVGQGFVHNFAGVVLFAVALALIGVVDALLGFFLPDGPLEPEIAPSDASTATPKATVTPMRSAWVMAMLMLLTAASSYAFLPKPQPEAQARANTPLEQLFPSEFGPWRLDPAAAALIRPAFERARQFQMYDQVLERTYMDEAGHRIMLSVAYGRQQSVGLQMHRPEVCYRAGGFTVSHIEPGELQILGRAIPVTRLFASLDGRPEPITYWRLLGNEVIADEARFKLRQLSAGGSGGIPDG
ncbi:MAG: EpsI family protein, partial [Aquabacterium sp.]|nr:EpsI family protein [Aquabacterium sp.]